MARARDASKIVLTWTPQVGVYGQTLQRRLLGSSTWTNIFGSQGSGVSTYTDTFGPGQTHEATDMPHTSYEYRIKNTNYYAPDTFTSVDTVVCKNCPTAGVTNIFGFKNETNGGGNVLDFTWFDPEAEWLNSNWNTSKSTARNITISSQSSGSEIELSCHKCGEDIDYSLNMMSGTTTVNGDFSYMTDYISIASWLPTPIPAFGFNSNSNMGNIVKKLDVVNTSSIAVSKFQLGVGNIYNSTFYPFTGKKMSGFGSATTQPTYASAYGDYNFKYIPNTTNSNNIFTGIRIGSSYGSAFDSALAAISGNSTYVAIVDEQFTQNAIAANTPYKCHMHMYKLTRWSAWDYNSGSGSGYQYNSRGFQMLYHNTLVIPISGSNDTYRISSTLHSDVNFYTEDPSTTNANLRNQPTVYLKIFTV
jgi:hypothetical protein